MRAAPSSSSFHTLMRLGLSQPRAHETLARQRANAWRWPVFCALVATIPAFYLELMENPYWPLMPAALYALGAIVLALSLWRVASATTQASRYLARNWLDGLQIVGLSACALMPTSLVSQTSLFIRLVVAGLTMIRMIWALQRLFSPAGTTYLLVLSTAVLMLCGLGFYWLDPKVHTLGEGLWLAFATAATVGYGDIVPSTTASRIFSVFVVLLGFGMLSLVTASVAAIFVENEERRIEREILQDLHRELHALRAEIRQLRPPPLNTAPHSASHTPPVPHPADPPTGATQQEASTNAPPGSHRNDRSR